jgi:hypothetical protein
VDREGGRNGSHAAHIHQFTQLRAIGTDPVSAIFSLICSVMFFFFNYLLVYCVHLKPCKDSGG